jgi:hypothetical protein
MEPRGLRCLSRCRACSNTSAGEWSFARNARTARSESFFLWDGDWEELRNLASRYQKYSTVATKRPVMMMWLSGRDNVVSTSDGRVNAYILERPPSAVPSAPVTAPRSAEPARGLP